MSIVETIKARRTVRAFRSDPIADDVVNELLEAATWAPSHFNAQPWEFALIGRQTRDQLRPIFRDMLENGPLKNPEVPEDKKAMMRAFMQDFGGAPVMLAVSCPPATIPSDIVDHPLATGAAIQNLLLAAWERNIGGVWLSIGQHPAVKAALGVPEAHSVIGVLPLGYFDAAPPALPRTPAADKLKRLP